MWSPNWNERSVFCLCATGGLQVVTCETIGTYAIRSAMSPNIAAVYVAVDFWRLRCAVSCLKSISAASKQQTLKSKIEREQCSDISSKPETVDKIMPSGFFPHLLYGVCLEVYMSHLRDDGRPCQPYVIDTTKAEVLPELRPRGFESDHPLKCCVGHQYLGHFA